MALSKRLISALIAFSMSATIATTAFAQTDNSITLNEEQNQLQTVEPSQDVVCHAKRKKWETTG